MALQTSDIERHRAAQTRLSELVAEELTRFFNQLNLTRPETARNALLAYVPLLVERYGEVATELAVEWYDYMRTVSGALGSFNAVPAPFPDDFLDQITGSIRYLAGGLWDPNAPGETLKPLLVRVDKYVKEPGRQTIIFNAEQEDNAWWARVPTGAETCSFCLVLASRGADYHSKRSAGSREYGEENLFHGDCDCDIVRLGINDEYPAGYLPEEIYDMYNESASRVGRNDLKAVLYDFRRRYPDAVSDGVQDDNYLPLMG